ncbi:FtsX-like permease family protein [Xylocopilactobacillus apis]|uniref:Permease n=1 Tax=Xylocopilactobacillus apis TaxID=2932183 RepID=A0AAU9CPK5_9LACO|nr:FtsX-like permease family protein [Xylocopilactobacillus apis]BDR55889.1 permease [Xylocopilactobacillus apis]
MTIKLALKGIKSRWKDYLVLFSGLMIAAAIFYMFQAIASNRAFLKANLHLNFDTLIYTSYLGSILLGIISLVYIFYANSFLLSIRQRVYAMYMMLGAKSRKIAFLIFTETLLIGILAVGLGLILGLGLTKVVGYWIIQQMDLTVSKFSIWSSQATIVTLGYFLIIFALIAILNARKLVKKPILQLLNQDQTPRLGHKNRLGQIIEILAGIILLALGYWTMATLKHEPFDGPTGVILGLIVALVTIVLGTYFAFDVIFQGIIELLRNNESFRFKKIHSFTLGQLSFRLRDFTRLLSMVTILFALSLGAITVGLAFSDQVVEQSDASNYYDLVLHDPSPGDLKEAQKLKLKSTSVYRIKFFNKKIVWNAGDFDRDPFLNLHFGSSKVEKITGQNLLKDRDSLFNSSLISYIPQNLQKFDSKIVTKEKYDRTKGEVHEIRLYKLQNFVRDHRQLKKLALKDNKKGSANSLAMINMSQKYLFYQDFNSSVSGFEFIGVFLGLAFLAMLASCLMFKILSSAPKDVLRYHRLNQLGARRNLLKTSIFQEIGALFLLPGILGIMHVLFGLQMFKATDLLAKPYGNLGVPFLIFLVLYLLYYLLTVGLYQKIVLPKVKK